MAFTGFFGKKVDERRAVFANRRQTRRSMARNKVLQKQSSAGISNQMSQFRKQIPVGDISSKITGGYEKASQNLMNLYKDRPDTTADYTSAKDEARGDLMPWRTAGTEALSTLQDKIATGPGDFEASPGYEFRKGEGTRAIESSAAARGGALSGRAIKEAARFNQGFASNEYGKFVDRFYQSLNPLQTMAGEGRVAAGQMGQYSMQHARDLDTSKREDLTGMSNALMFGAQGIEKGQMYRGNALTSAYSAALQMAENERGRTDARETELRAYDEANNLRRAAALEKRRKARNKFNIIRDNTGTAWDRSTQQIPYY